MPSADNLSTPLSRLLAFARDLRRAASFEDLSSATRNEVRASVGYEHAWLMVSEIGDAKKWCLVDDAGSLGQAAKSVVPVLPIADDAILEEIVRGDRPVVIADARTDPRTDKKLTAQLGSRTLIYVPLCVFDEPIGAFGAGTFGDDEGCAPPSAEQLDYLVGMASPIEVAAGRIRGLEERRRAAETRRRAERAAETATAELDAFCYAVAHDLRAPLRTIEGFGNLLLGDYAARLDEEGRGYLDHVLGSARRMSRLISDLLELSRISRAPLRREPLDVSRMARAIVDDLRSQEPARVVATTVADGLRAAADPRLVKVALEALIGNAWKFTSTTADATITVGREESGFETIFFVRDTGVGFDMAYAGKLFAPFQRLHSATDFPGNGVGLAMARRVVARHGGRIWAEAEAARGASFFFTLEGAQSRQA